MDTRPASRALEIATAIALGVVSLVTALGVLQSSVWNDTADRLGADSADARDQSIAISVVAQLRQRADLASLLEARLLARDYDDAIAAENFELAMELLGDITATLGNATSLPEGSFDAWYAADFPDDARPTDSALYVAATRGSADALILTSQRLGGLAKELTAKSAIFGQAALVHALALFLFGVAGINRLRAARYVTLAMGRDGVPVRSRPHVDGVLRWPR